MLKLNKEKIIDILRYAEILVLPFVIFTVQECFYKVINRSSAKEPIIKSHILSFVIMCGLFFLLFGIMKTTFRATVTLSILVAVLMIVNQLKLVYSSNPVFLRDIGFLSTPGTFTDILEENVGGILSEMMWNVIVMVLTLAALCFITYKNNITLKNKKHRLLSSGIALAFFLLMLLPVQPVNDVVIKAFFEIDEKKNNNTVSNAKYYYQHGFFAGLFGEYLITTLREPDAYNRAETVRMLENAEADNEAGDEWGKPNIIMVFSESFFDVSVIDEVKFDVDVASNIHQLSGKGMLTDMISPSFGGISCNPEFEMLTGGSLKFFPDNYIPYMNLYTDDRYAGVPSVIGELKNNGYKTHIFSCWGKNLFNAENVYTYLGVDKTEYVTSVEKRYKKGGRISDEYVTDRIIDAFENKGDEPLFYMALTAQNHMPFTESKYSSYDIKVESTELSEEDTGMIKAYAQGVYDADKQLKRLYDYIQTLDEPTMIIFYGDHLPFLKTDGGKDVYEKLGYFNTEDELLNTYRLYNTKCLMLDNFGAEYDDIPYMGYDLVMSYVMNRMDCELSPYYRWLYTTIGTLPAANRYVTVDAEGKLYYTGSLKGELKDTYEKRQKANWNIFVDID